MKAMLIRTPKGLHGATPDDHAAYAKFKRRLETMQPGKWLRLEWSAPRNGPHHRKMFALLSLVAENSETYNTTAKALVAVKLAAGYFDPHVEPKTGEIIPIPQSISYDAMDQDSFERSRQEGPALDKGEHPRAKEHKPASAKPCEYCGREFLPFQSTQKVCPTLRCAKGYAQAQRKAKEKAERESDRKRAEALKSVKQLKAEAQDAFNDFIRERDKDLPCVSCEETNPPMKPGGQWDAGHFLSRGAYPELAFDEDNCHKQCKSCNAGGGKFAHKARTVNAAYEEELLRRIGPERLARLKGPHSVEPLKKDELRRLKAHYRAKKRELEKRTEYGMSRQQAHQIAKRAGLLGLMKEIRAAKAAARPRPQRIKKGRDRAVYSRAARIRAAVRYGVTFEEYERLALAGAVKAFQAQRGCAGTRGVEWALTLSEWWGIWQWSGHWERRGRGRGKYVMARFRDEGPYAANNVRIITFTENLQEAMKLRLQGIGLPG
jgi:hypothetical protein